jgi:mannose-6-phosphate isomerase
MVSLPPLRFEPILRQYLWGGRRLADLGKPLGEGDHYAESWEIVDHGDDQSVVAGGPLTGTRLRDLVLQHGPALFGRHHPQNQFPLLFKFLDCQKTLSVQVHPNDAQASRLQPPDLGKTEAWVVLASEPGAKIYAGLKPGVRRTTLERGIAAGLCADCLHHFEPQPGDCVFIEAGTVHALGAGLLIAEIQQASDTTFRLFDWNRVDRDGKPRQLHIRESLDTINFSRGQVGPQQPATTDRSNAERLVACDKFVMDRWNLDATELLENDDRFHIIAAVEGRLVVTGDGIAHTLQRGGTLLVPASCHQIELQPQGRAVLLDIYLP